MLLDASLCFAFTIAIYLNHAFGPFGFNVHQYTHALHGGYKKYILLFSLHLHLVVLSLYKKLFLLHYCKPSAGRSC